MFNEGVVVTATMIAVLVIVAATIVILLLLAYALLVDFQLRHSLNWLI